jgi:hypothetical protein
VAGAPTFNDYWPQSEKVGRHNQGYKRNSKHRDTGPPVPMNLKLVKTCSIVEEVTEGSLEEEINPNKRVESIWRPKSSIEVDPRIVPMFFVNRRIFSINSVVSHCS